MASVNLLKVLKGADPNVRKVKYFGSFKQVERVFKEGRKNKKLYKKVMGK